MSDELNNCTGAETEHSVFSSFTHLDGEEDEKMRRNITKTTPSNELEIIT